MMYSINLTMQGRKAVVIGGGKVAQRKVKTLLVAGADVTIVSPQITDELKKFAIEGSLIWLCKDFSQEDLEDAFIIIAATDNPEINLSVKKNARKSQLVNLVDDPELSDFQLPAVIQRGMLSLAVSTSGASPLLAKKIRDQLAGTFDERYEAYLDFLADCRKIILTEVMDDKKKRQLLRAITDESFLDSKNREKKFAEILLKTFQEEKE